NNGTTTAEDGSYSINVSNIAATLVFTSVGYTTQENPVPDSQMINVTLLVDESELDEVVVIGYQSIRKKDLTGAASVVNTKNTEAKVARSLPEALQGQSSGVVVRKDRKSTRLNSSHVKISYAV